MREREAAAADPPPAYLLDVGRCLDGGDAALTRESDEVDAVELLGQRERVVLHPWRAADVTQDEYDGASIALTLHPIRHGWRGRWAVCWQRATHNQ